ncbi:cell division protein SepF [Paenibacillus sp. N1-5-1-14]|uniref:cell division protein SepF n=1 Tax=Paenibacillus radicibacter TaxID=2972488 RepID=UPI0021599943|nr:cell division protein SepF [Paenibacillus radicibacter]MCR8641904.1 cell division protein SepF [Paenibacillus radicibacter]
MGVIKKFMNYIGLQEEEQDVEYDKTREREMDKFQQPNQQHEEEEMEFVATEPRPRPKNNIVPIHSQKNSRVMLYEPRSFEDAQELADHLRNRRAVVVNLQRIRSEVALRIVDFLSGTVYALNGSISKLGPGIYLCTPDSMEIQGSISDIMYEN